MSSRQEEKEARRLEREATRQAEAASAARKKRLGVAAGGILGVAALAAVVVAIVAAGGGGDENRGAGAGKQPSAKVELPEQKISDLEPAAKAAGCMLENPPIEGSSHVDGKVEYKTNPPTSGNHRVDPTPDGVYPPGKEDAVEGTLHALEHSRVIVQYAKGSPAPLIAKLEALVAESGDGYHQLLFRNQTAMPFAVAATAWGHSIGCKEFKPAAFDALRAFRQRYTDKGPEQVP